MESNMAVGNSYWNGKVIELNEGFPRQWSLPKIFSTCWKPLLLVGNPIDSPHFFMMEIKLLAQCSAYASHVLHPIFAYVPICFPCFPVFCPYPMFSHILPMFFPHKFGLSSCLHKWSAGYPRSGHPPRVTSRCDGTLCSHRSTAFGALPRLCTWRSDGVLSIQ